MAIPKLQDLRENDPDCGYYADSGTWVLYPWVHPVSGGKPPKGSHPRPPKGVKGTPPRGTSGGGSGRTGNGGTRPQPPARPAPAPPPARRR